MSAFNGGVSENVHCRKYKLRHLRIKAGPNRDQYVHDLVIRAKILGRREAWELDHPGQPVPETDFHRYLDVTFETVDHHNNNSLDNSPENLVRMTRGENAAKANRRRAEKAQANREKKAAKAEKARQAKAGTVRIADTPF